MGFRVDVHWLRKYEDIGSTNFYRNRGSLIPEPVDAEFRREFESLDVPRVSMKPIRVRRIRAEIDYKDPFVSAYSTSKYHNLEWETKPREIHATSSMDEPNTWVVAPLFLHGKITEGSRLEVAAAYDILRKNTSKLRSIFREVMEGVFNITLPFECTVFGYENKENRFLPTDKYTGRFREEFGKVSYLGAAKTIAGRIRRNT